MGLKDKMENAKEKLTGQAKEATGKLRDDESQEFEGRADQAKADIKQSGEKVKDALDE